MSFDRLLPAGLLVAGLAVMGGYAISQGSGAAVAAEDGPGPNLVIEVDGQAKGVTNSASATSSSAVSSPRRRRKRL